MRNDHYKRKVSLHACVLLVAGGLACASALAKSLFDESTYQALAADRTASRVGDLLTVLVYENSSATSAANTSASREGGAGLGFEAKTDIGTPHHAGTASGTLSLESRRAGLGRTQREGRVLAQITVVVREVAPNGDLIVDGEQSVDVNDEQQRIQLEGRVRRQDVSATNTVMSMRVAGAKIRYIGEGDIAERQRPTWWQRLLSAFGI